jgi:RNA polymerase sigma factor (sigma-70 family)
MLGDMARSKRELTTLVRRAQAGDVEAYGVLVDRTQRMVFATALSVLKNRELSLDAMQETFLRAFSRLGSLDDPQAFPAWLKQVALSAARNLLRRSRISFVDVSLLSEVVVDDSGILALEAADERTEALSCLQRAVVRMSPFDRRLCERFYHGGWTAARIAEEEGISGVAVRKRLERIRKWLRKEIEMERKGISGEGWASGLPERIVQLLSKPVLTDLPENPVGAVWEVVKATHPEHQEVTVAETVTSEQVRSIVGERQESAIPEFAHRIGPERLLRWDLTLPMLLASRDLPGEQLFMAAGKVYRAGQEGKHQLETFHQAEVLLMGKHMSEWHMMGPITGWLDALLPGARVRVEQMDFPMYCDRGWVVSVLWDGDWVPVIGWGLMKDDIVRAIGRDPDKLRAVGVGMGLERIACLKYGIDDLRKVESSRI